MGMLSMQLSVFNNFFCKIGIHPKITIREKRTVDFEGQKIVRDFDTKYAYCKCGNIYLWHCMFEYDWYELLDEERANIIREKYKVNV